MRTMRCSFSTASSIVAMDTAFSVPCLGGRVTCVGFSIQSSGVKVYGLGSRV